MASSASRPAPSAPAAVAKALAALLLAAALAAPPLAAQKAGAPPHVPVSGTVLEAGTRAPVARAVIAFPKLRTMAVSDSLGRFQLARIPVGTHAVEVSRVGYETVEVQAQVTEGAELEVSLTPQPLVLERLNVTSNRLERRRRAIAFAVRALEQDELALSGAFNAADVARTRLGIMPAYCPSYINVPGGGQNCAYVRGRVQPVRVVIDELPAIGGMDQISLYNTNEIYLMEWYPSMAQLRVYTNWFVERLARRPGPLMPIWR